jgi:signal transduction histidine kinase
VQECAPETNPGDSDLQLVAQSPWWPPASSRGTEALDRLWRYATGLAWMAREIARGEACCDPDRAGRLALLHPLGLWALAATAPDDLADWLDLPDLQARRQWESTRLGDDPYWLGKRLAERWGGSAGLVAATWVPAEPSGWITVHPEERSVLVTIQRARRRISRSPLALFGPPGVGPIPPPNELKRWLAGRQGWCGSTFCSAAATPAEETLSRSHARLLLQIHRQQARLASANALVEAVAQQGEAARQRQDAPPGGEETSTLKTAWASWNSLVAENERLRGEARQARRDVRTPQELNPARSPAQILQAMAEFAAGAGHELNNPLAVIMGRAQLLLSRVPDSDSQRSLRVIIGQTQRAHRMLRDLMFIARPPASRPRPCQPEELVRRTLEDLRPEAEARKIQLGYATSATRRMAEADPDHLRHLVEVLVRNALEASPPGSTVTTRLQRTDGGLVLQVADQGPGLSRAEEKHLLVPFYCGRQAGRGLGLGLSRVAGYLTSIGGTLNWSTEPGAGTVFTVRLPVEELTDRNVA